MDAAESSSTDQKRIFALIALASVSGIGYAVLLWLSGQFGGDTPSSERPTLTMLALFAGEFACYFLALKLVIQLPSTKWLFAGIFAAACLFRGVLLPSIPMHEIDIYRYVWDGAVLADGVSPYRYAPQQVIAGVDDPLSVTDETLQQLVELQANSQSLAESLREIHYGHFPSPYPVVSQIVFAFSAQLTPDDASKHRRLVIMKSLLVLMDLATLVVVMLLIRDVGLHAGWSLAYGWCPLLMKEVANGGHLDSIAVFLTTLAVWLLVRTWQASRLAEGKSTWFLVALTGAMLALAIGAKLFPVVLVPLFAAVWLRRHGWSTVIVGLVSTAVITMALLYPLFGPATQSVALVKPTEPNNPAVVPLGQLNTPAVESPPTKVDPDAGVQAFLNQWEMNDLVFMVVLENLRPQEAVAEQYKPWFVVTSDDWSRSVVTRWAAFKQRLRRQPMEVAQLAVPLSQKELKAESFSLARVLTGGVFFVIACWLAWRAAGQSDPHAWCRACMLTLAWFWLTCPTQNPWYWCWVLPLLPFARYRTWYIVAALTMLYYLRFWLTAHYPDPPVLGTPYSGAYFFYYVIAWVEFMPCFVALSIEWLSWRRSATTTD